MLLHSCIATYEWGRTWLLNWNNTCVLRGERLRSCGWQPGEDLVARDSEVAAVFATYVAPSVRRGCISSPAQVCDKLCELDCRSYRMKLSLAKVSSSLLSIFLSCHASVYETKPRCRTGPRNTSARSTERWHEGPTWPISLKEN